MNQNSINYLKGDSGGSMNSYIGFALKTVYLVFIGFKAYNFSAVAKLFSTKKIIFTLIAINVLLSFSTLLKGHDWGDDFSLYIAQAKVMCEGGFEQLKSQQLFTQTNNGYKLGPDFYPWGFPALITPAYKIFGFNLTVFKIVTFAWFPLLLWLLFVSFKNELGDKMFYYIALFALSPVIFEFRDSIASDIPFMFFSTLGVLLIRRVVSEKEMIFNEIFSYSLLGIVIFFSYSVRTAGIVLLPTLLFTQLYEFFFNQEKLRNEKRKQILLHLIPYFLFSILFAVYYKLTGYIEGLSDSSYASQLDWKLFYNQIRFNFIYYLKSPSEFFRAPVLSSISSMLWGIIFFFVLWGITGLKKMDVPFFFIFNIYAWLAPVVTIPHFSLYFSCTSFCFLFSDQWNYQFRKCGK